MTRPRIGIYDRFWSTMGGGEQHAGTAAAVLAEKYDVELIGLGEFDRSRFSNMLGKPVLADLPLKVVGLEPTAVAEASRNYDLFINHSYTSEDVSLAPKSIYVVFFPQIYGKSAMRKFERHFRLQVESTTGLSEVAHDKLRFAGRAELSLKAKFDGQLTFSVEGSDVRVAVSGEGTTMRVVAETDRRRLIAVSFLRGTSEIAIGAPSASVLTPQLAGGQRVPFQHPALLSDSSPAFVDSYDLVLGNSQYTTDWIQRRWQRDAVVHYPPVVLRDFSPAKSKTILSLGRFFDESRGHSKQQLRLVRAFKKMVDQGLTDWRLVLVGGCDKANREYALNVRREAVDYPIDVYLNADLDMLNKQLQDASIYWHATGFGVDLDTYPERAEHFGIAPVEAMSAGAIPVVYSLGGPREIVDAGTNGFTFTTEDDLIARTLEIIHLDKSQRTTMAKVAADSACRFSEDRFASELLEHVRRLLGA